MRLRPAVTTDEALEWLKLQATAAWGVEVTPAVEVRLRRTAQAMEAVSHADVPPGIEPQQGVVVARDWSQT